MSWKPEYIILIIISTLIDYFSAIQIHKSISLLRKKLFLFLSLFSNLGLLFAFKYFNFFSDSARLFLNQFSISFNPILLNVLLPVGISFYTFQTLSYTIDVYNKKLKPQRHLGIFAVYVSFFPQLVAGPIERAKNLMPQFFEKHSFKYERVMSGLRLMLWGFFKKVVIADRLAIFVNLIYDSPNLYSGLAPLIATVFFTFQIYCDFSGYSDIAIGSARVMGFELMENFRRPYFSRSISEFWKRWHISLSTWFRDYAYIPLGGNRVSIPKWYFNVFVVFIVSGLWHGANWTFVIWGALHGVYILIELYFKPQRAYFLKISKLVYFPKLINSINLLITFILVSFAWIFFRANSLSDAIILINSINFSTSFQWEIFSANGFGVGSFLVVTGTIIFMELVHIFQEFNLKKYFKKNIVVFNVLISYILIFWILLFGVFMETKFIYFQF